MPQRSYRILKWRHTVTCYNYIQTSAGDTINSPAQAISNTKHIGFGEMMSLAHPFCKGYISFHFKAHRSNKLMHRRTYPQVLRGSGAHSLHYIETNTGGMAIANIATISSPKLLSARSLAHRLVSIPQGRYTILRTTLQRASQIKGLPNFRKSREYL